MEDSVNHNGIKHDELHANSDCGMEKDSGHRWHRMRKRAKTKVLTWERKTFQPGNKCETILFTNCFLVYFNKAEG